MPDLNFQVCEAKPQRHAAAPALLFTIDIRAGAAATTIHAIALRCQIRIEPTKRRYAEHEREGLLDLFGEPARWGQTLRSMLWTHATVMTPPFAGSTRVDLVVPCTYDFNVASTKYFYALDDGQVPLCFLFSGTVFYESADGALQVTQISWEKEANFLLPVSVWKDMMDMYYPNSAWMCLRKDVFDKLYRYKVRNGVPTWEQTLEELLARAEQPVPS